jgi:hypothetical protein
MAVGDDRNSRTTAEFDREDLAKLATRSVRAPTDPGELLGDESLARGSDRPHRANNVEHRPTEKIHKDELLGLLNLTSVVADAPNTGDVVALETRDRKTQRMRAKQFQQLLRNGQATMPITPELLESIDWHGDADAAADEDLEIAREPEAMLAALEIPAAPATQQAPIHEQVASRGLIAQALAEMKAAGIDDKRLAGPTIDITPAMLEEAATRRAASATVEVTPAMLQQVAARTTAPLSPQLLDELALRPQSETLPLSPELIQEITATAPPPEKRPAVEMRPIERPRAPALTSPPIELTRRKAEAVVEPTTRIPRFATEDEPVVAPPRSDIGLMIVVSLIVLAIVMTMTWLVI